METIEVQKVMDRKKVAEAIHSVLDSGIEMLKKTKLDGIDFGKLKVIRTMGPHVNAGVAMIQQETAQIRAQLIAERMKQLGYGEAPQITG